MNSLNSCLTRGLLIAAGLLAAGIAAMIVLAPGRFYAGYGIDIGNNVNLANELKAPAGMLLATSLMMLAGAFRKHLLLRSLVVASALFSSFGLSRLVSMAIDGIPSSGLISAAAIELALGALCLTALYHHSRREQGWT